MFSNTACLAVVNTRVEGEDKIAVRAVVGDQIVLRREVAFVVGRRHLEHVVRTNAIYTAGVYTR